MESLIIKNFKCFYDVEVPLNRLTVFAGANGNGKSTAIQALLYLRRTIEHCARWSKNHYSFSELNGLNVELNGAYCLALGSSNYVLPRDSSESLVHLGLLSGKSEFFVEYSVGDNELWLSPVRLSKEKTNQDSSLFLQQFYYLNAERIGPRISQQIQFFDFPNTGFKGEYVGQLIGDPKWNYAIKINEDRRHENSDSNRLEQQVNAWLDYLMPGISIRAAYSPDTGSAQILVDNQFTQGDHTVATNIGFGVSYVLPIIVTGLIAQEGSFMVVENPEAHLHPAAQSRVGRFLSIIAQSGVNIVVETHSDHLLNGIQISAASKEIKASLVTINYFNQEDGDRQPNVESIKVNERGELDTWPKGFFDQSQRDFAELHNLRKK